MLRGNLEMGRNRRLGTTDSASEISENIHRQQRYGHFRRSAISASTSWKYSRPNQARMACPRGPSMTITMATARRRARFTLATLLAALIGIGLIAQIALIAPHC
jgi:hypothetical protein